MSLVGPRARAFANAWPAPAGSASTRSRDLYFAALLWAVAAYALTGRGFAYAGIPPVFPSEILLVAGLWVYVRPRPSLAVFASAPSLMLVLLMGWTLWRTLPFVGTNGVDALRDSVIVMYGLFAFVFANLILENPSRIDLAMGWARRFFSIYGALAAILYVLPKYLGAAIPRWPSGQPILGLRGGEVAVHIGAAAIFALLGLKRSSIPWTGMLLVGIVVVSAQSRGGMLAIVVPLLVAILLTGRLRAPALVIAAMLPFIVVLYVTDFEFPMESDRRTVTISQLAANTSSIFVKADTVDKTLDDTKLWRLQWWDKIFAYTLHGPYLWTGKGFGINIAESDGYLGTGGTGAPLRSPHSSHMTMLARSGVPGLALWAATGLSWLWLMLRRIYLARVRGNDAWSRILIFVMCDWLGIVIDSSFDVAVEGPMLGIVFWVLFGAGLGLSLTYDALCASRLAERRADASPW